ncbi:inactive Ufm1-specific protease 1 [Malaclemys terrapin pileata]|uniref:inactive Ufm1-specific protease 1 n=1 Tax=Malaclemys terrapin pileata TaxID=2991368 RepID=UPI0023A8719A|nr:inactive Ufm1-specific protease 1 [Malaclemys terrapin pileata]
MEGAGDVLRTLLPDVHRGLPFPGSPTRAALVSGSYLYYHYGCDGVDDRGWGCGYRTLQTLCSWLAGVGAGSGACPRPVPSLLAIQQALVEMGDKPTAFAGSRDWIGTVEAALCMDHFFGVPCKILHSPWGRGLGRQVGALYAHFQGGGGPVMLGGDADSSSKGLLGVCSVPAGHHLLVLDPHYYWGAGDLGREGMQAAGWVRWQGLASFDPASFYNLCLPQFWRAAGERDGAGEN